MLKNNKERRHYLQSSNNWHNVSETLNNKIHIQKLRFVNLYRLLIATNGKYRPYDDGYFKIINIGKEGTPTEIEHGIYQTEAINEIYRTPDPELESRESVFLHYKSVEEHNKKLSTRMFEELGYEKEETERFIKYSKEVEKGNGFIEFSKKYKTVCAYLDNNEYLTLDTKELMAISQQLEELRRNE